MPDDPMLFIHSFQNLVGIYQIEKVIRFYNIFSDKTGEMTGWMIRIRYGLKNTGR